MGGFLLIDYPIENLLYYLLLVKINEKITALELRVIAEDGSFLGVLSLGEALKLAKEKGLDLIEVAPTAKPPVAKIMSFDKYRYQEEKKLKKQKAGQKAQGMKRVQITVKAAKHDLEVRASQVNKFFEKGHLVEIYLALRGREKYNRPWARERLAEFLKMIDPDHKVIMQPTFLGKGFSVQVAKNKK